MGNKTFIESTNTSRLLYTCVSIVGYPRTESVAIAFVYKTCARMAHIYIYILNGNIYYGYCQFLIKHTN